MSSNCRKDETLNKISYSYVAISQEWQLRIITVHFINNGILYASDIQHMAAHT